MTRDELLPIALRHGFGHCEVGVRMIGLVHEIIELCARDCDALYKHDRKSSGYDEGWNDGLDYAEQAIRKRITG